MSDSNGNGFSIIGKPIALVDSAGKATVLRSVASQDSWCRRNRHPSIGQALSALSSGGRMSNIWMTQRHGMLVWPEKSREVTRCTNF